MKLVPKNTGEVYYGKETMRKIVNPPLSRFERWIVWYDQSPWAGWALLAIGAVFFIGSLSAIIYDWGR